MKFLTALVLMLGVFAFTGCEDKTAPTKPAEETHSEDDGHDHGAEESHEGHDHGAEGHDGEESHEGHDH